MGAFLLHKHEWCIALVAFILLLSVRIDQTLRTQQTKAKYEDDPLDYKYAHQAKLVKEWVTSQYCKVDLDILCPNDRLRLGECSTAFDPPLRFVLDLPKGDLRATSSSCSLKELIKHTDWKDRDTVGDLNQDELLTYFIAHLLDQVRSKSGKYFRAEDRTIKEYEQSRLIEMSLASIIDLFSSPTKLDISGQTISTRAVDSKMTTHIWTKSEVISLMHDAVLWHTHHRRNGPSAAGAAAHLSRQQPSFVFKFLPLVKEQIQDLELDNKVQSRFQKLYSLPYLEKDKISLDQDRPESDQCLWSHFEEGSLISEDCMLALETAPLKIRDLDWEGDFLFVLIRIYTCFTAAFMLWMLTRNQRQHGMPQHSEACTPPGMEVITSSKMSSSALVDAGESHRDRIKRMQRASLAYLVLGCSVGLVSSYSSETLQISDFFDGLCLTLLGFMSLHFVPLEQERKGARRDQHIDEGSQLPDRPADRHYKKRASLIM